MNEIHHLPSPHVQANTHTFLHQDKYRQTHKRKYATRKRYDRIVESALITSIMCDAHRRTPSFASILIYLNYRMPISISHEAIVIGQEHLCHGRSVLRFGKTD